MQNSLFDRTRSRVAPGLLAAVLAVSLQGQLLVQAASNFVDVTPTFWADKYIDYLSSRQVITGYPDQTFRPNQPVTRAEFAVMLAKSQNMPTGTASVAPFADVPAGHWAAGAIQSVANRGWIAGYPGNRFMPNQPISMAEMYTIVAKSSGQQLVSETEANTLLNKFADMAQVPVWARTSVATAAKNGLSVDELSKTQLMPNVQATRASVATSLAKLLNTSFRDADNVATQPTTGTPVNVSGTLQATARAGEWVVVDAAGKQYVLNNPGNLTQQPWFKIGNKVQLQGNLDTTASTTQRPVVNIQSLAAAQQTQTNDVALSGILRPSTITSGAWVVQTPDNKVYRILNPEQFTSLPWFRYGSSVSVKGNTRPDVSLPQGEGTALVASSIEVGTAASQTQGTTTITGTLQPTVEAGGWVVTDTATNKKYVLLGTEQSQGENWFKTGTRVTVKGDIRTDIPTIYMEGPVLMVSDIDPFAMDIAGQQNVKLYYPNLISAVQGQTLGDPIVRVMEGPNLPTKVAEAIVSGPQSIEQLRGYYQDEDIRKLDVERVTIGNDGKATVILEAPADFTAFKNTLIPARLQQAMTMSLSQFPGITDVDVRVESPSNKVIWKSGN